MAGTSRRKSLRLAQKREDDNIDRLSSLSECVLLQILSLLDLKEAAATSVLSTCWRDLFLQLPEIHLTFCVNDHPFDQDALFHHFTLFANRVLQQRNPEEPIASLKLCVEQFTDSFRPDFSSLLMTTAAAISTYKVEELHVSVERDGAGTQPCFLAIPPPMFSSETLAGLSLNICETWNFPQFVWLPKLRYVHLISFKLVDENSIQRLLNGCPMLEDMLLVMTSFKGRKTETLSLSSSSLKLLIIAWDGRDGSELSVFVKSESLEKLTFSLSGGHKVNVDTPNLKYFSIRGQVLEVNIIRPFLSIKEAFIDAEYLFQLVDLDDLYSRSQNAATFFDALQDVQLLNLSENIMKAIYVAALAMPTFRRLYHLRLVPVYCRQFPRSWISQVIFNLLLNCPNIEMLSFQEVFNNYFGDQEVFEKVFPLTFTERVKEIQMFSFEGRQLEYKMVEFLLNNGQSLETVTLLQEKDWKPYQCKKILSFKKCSEDCEIIFI